MSFKYRVKGIVEKSFILRGAYFPIGMEMDFYISESELEFVSARCKVAKLIDLKEKLDDAPKPVLEETESKPKGVKNELQRKSTSSTSKNKHKAGI